MHESRQERAQFCALSLSKRSQRKGGKGPAQKEGMAVGVQENQGITQRQRDPSLDFPRATLGEFLVVQ